MPIILLVFAHGDRCCCIVHTAAGEGVFVARPGSNAEDDGVVVAPGVSASGQSFMLVMDAATWTELARVELPYGTPYRFHGTWINEA